MAGVFKMFGKQLLQDIATGHAWNSSSHKQLKSSMPVRQYIHPSGDPKIWVGGVGVGVREWEETVCPCYIVRRRSFPTS